MIAFENLSEKVRIYSVEEFVSDFEGRNLYVSKKLVVDKILIYCEGIVNALLRGDVKSFSQHLAQHNCLTVDALKTSNAAEVLAYSEFKRYYIRGVCLHALSQTPKKLLQICYTRRSAKPSEDASGYIGDIMHPERMLAVARICPGTKMENTLGLEHRILRPNSGLCVEILDTVEKVKTLNNGRENND